MQFRLSYHLARASPLPLDMGYFFWWDPTFCSVVSCNFGILAREDEHTSFYATILSLLIDIKYFKNIVKYHNGLMDL